LTVAGGVPSWATPAGSSPNYTLINTGGTALTGAATITISGISGKNQLFVTIIGCSSASGNSNFYIRLNGDAANYGYFNAIMIAPDSVTEDSAASTSLMYIGAISANAGSVLSGYCLVDGCNSSGVKVMHHSTGSTNAGGGNAQLNTGGGTWSDSATVSSISIISSAGNFDAGTIYVYGA
jgi:phage-related tail fiber protein